MLIGYVFHRTLCLPQIAVSCIDSPLEYPAFLFRLYQKFLLSHVRLNKKRMWEKCGGPRNNSRSSPSPVSKISNSPPRIITAEDSPLVAVGTAADVPKNKILISTIVYVLLFRRSFLLLSIKIIQKIFPPTMLKI